MVRTLFSIAGLILWTPTGSSAQAASAFSHGPSIQFVRLTYVEVPITPDPASETEIDAQVELLQSGAGYSFNFNLFPGEDEKVRWFSIGIPLFARLGLADEGVSVAVSLGVTFGTYNNLFSIGVAYDLFDVRPGTGDTGLFVDPELENLAVLLNFGFNLGGGDQPDDPSISPTEEAPPVYLAF